MNFGCFFCLVQYVVYSAMCSLGRRREGGGKQRRKEGRERCLHLELCVPKHRRDPPHSYTAMWVLRIWVSLGGGYGSDVPHVLEYLGFEFKSSSSDPLLDIGRVAKRFLPVTVDSSSSCGSCSAHHRSPVIKGLPQR